MHSLLIVDNEHRIVDSLLFYFERQQGLEMTLYGAYGARAALEIMSRTKIDILVTDIRMPEIDGLKLQAMVKERWPWCRTIFLTGYDDFTYAQTAIRTGGVDYLLKTEGQEAVLRAVQKAVRQLEEEVKAEELQAQAKTRLTKALPLMRKNVLMQLIYGKSLPDCELRTAFRESEMPFSVDSPMLMMLGRFQTQDGMGCDALTLYAIEEMAEKYLDVRQVIACPITSHKEILWFFVAGGDGKAAVDVSKQCVYLQGVAEMLQQSGKRLLQISGSFAITNQAGVWEMTGERLSRLRYLLNIAMLKDEVAILLDSEAAAFEQTPPAQARRELGRADLLQEYLQCGQKMAFWAQLGKMEAEAAMAPKEIVAYVQWELYTGIISILMRCINTQQMQHGISVKMDITKAMRYTGWEDGLATLRELAGYVFELGETKEREYEDTLVSRLSSYIHRNLGGDLSLPRLGEMEGMNPYYMARLYKTMTGDSLTEYIAGMRLKKAQQCLGESKYVIREIAAMVGFSTEQSFHRFFKQHVGITPQEYRDRLKIDN